MSFQNIVCDALIVVMLCLFIPEVREKWFEVLKDEPNFCSCVFSKNIWKHWVYNDSRSVTCMGWTDTDFAFIPQRQLTPTSDSKKVTFGLKNNKTAGKKLRNNITGDSELLFAGDGLGSKSIFCSQFYFLKHKKEKVSVGLGQVFMPGWQVRTSIADVVKALRGCSGHYLSITWWAK